MKGVVLAGGLGTRLSPLTKITNKHLLPIYNKPMICYPIQTLVEAGIDDIMIVMGGEYAGDFMRLLQDGKDFGLTHISYAYQVGNGGIADALKLCEQFIFSEKFVVILGDNIFTNSEIRICIKEFEEQELGARVVLKRVPDPQRFGVADIKGDKITSIEEKPIKPKSDYAVTGIYMYDFQVWEMLKGLMPSKRGELEITDVNNTYIAISQLEYSIIEKVWTDAGTFESLYFANKIVKEGKL